MYVRLHQIAIGAARFVWELDYDEVALQLKEGKIYEIVAKIKYQCNRIERQFYQM